MEAVKITLFLGLVFKAAGHVIGASFSLVVFFAFAATADNCASARDLFAVCTTTTLTPSESNPAITNPHKTPTLPILGG